MRYRVTGYDRSGSNLFSRVVEAMGPDHAKIVALVELRKSFADAHLADQAERLEQAKADFPDAPGSVQGEPEDRLNKSPRGWEAAGGSNASGGTGATLVG